MINEPIKLTTDDFQQAWLEVVRILIRRSWEVRNLMVQIKNPQSFDSNLHQKISRFSKDQGLLSPKHIAYTIFPHRLYEHEGEAAQLFHAYNRPNGLFRRLHRRKPSWGTYFQRMTYYDKNGEIVNQLSNIIQAIRTRDKLSKAAYTIIVQNPGGETIRPRGGPCLNYVAVQIEPRPKTLGLLAVYRNHDFLKRAYGNYWGLCNLLKFMATEVEANIGPLTCVSSRAYVDNGKVALKSWVEGL